jgi:hypothetical protein
MFWKHKSKPPSYLRFLASSGEPYVPELRGDGLTVETAFKEFVLPPGKLDDYDRYLTPLHGKRGKDWLVDNEEYVETNRRHFLVELVSIRLSTGEIRKYYFDKSANFRVLYADEMESIRRVREEYLNRSWYKELIDLFKHSF